MQAHQQHGASLIPALIWAGWFTICVCLSLWVAELVGYNKYQESIRFVGLAVATGAALSGYLFNNLRDFRKQLKDDAAFLNRREVANLNHLITIGQRKAIGITALYLVTALYMSLANFWLVDSQFFLVFVFGVGILIGACIAAAVSSCVNLFEITRFEEKLSNIVKAKKTSKAALSAFKGEKTES